jgi:hypothetical protein
MPVIKPVRNVANHSSYVHVMYAGKRKQPFSIQMAVCVEDVKSGYTAMNEKKTPITIQTGIREYNGDISQFTSGGSYYCSKHGNLIVWGYLGGIQPCPNCMDELHGEFFKTVPKNSVFFTRVDLYDKPLSFDNLLTNRQIVIEKGTRLRVLSVNNGRMKPGELQPRFVLGNHSWVVDIPYLVCENLDTFAVYAVSPSAIDLGEEYQSDFDRFAQKKADEDDVANKLIRNTTRKGLIIKDIEILDMKSDVIPPLAIRIVYKNGHKVSAPLPDDFMSLKIDEAYRIIMTMIKEIHNHCIEEQKEKYNHENTENEMYCG